MKAKLFQNNISVRPSKVHNYGVFADKNIRKGELIEECYVVGDTRDPDILIDFTFSVGDDRIFIAGYAMVYNHSKSPNAIFSFNRSNQTMSFVASRFIRKGEEIFITYGENWFKQRGLEEKNLPVRVGLINPVTLSLTRVALVSGAVYGGFLLMMHYYQPWLKLMLSFKI
ncbi:MAG: SET domain-containing protein-lysine N-methyltransferase [Pseudomonadota bacterium]